MRSKIFSRVGALLGTIILVLTSMAFLSSTASAQEAEAFPPEIPEDIPVSPNIPEGSSGSGVQGFVPAIGSRAKDTAGKKQLAQFGKAEVEMLLQHSPKADIDGNGQQKSNDKFYWNLQVSWLRFSTKTVRWPVVPNSKNLPRNTASKSVRSNS